MSLTSLVPSRRDATSLNRRESTFDALQREIDRVFDSFTRGFPMFTGPYGSACCMDVSETDKDIEIACELPGLEQKDVQISMAGDVLTIRGEKQVEREDKTKTYQMTERSCGSFSRQVQLPANVDPGSIRAEMSKGVLKVTVPKPVPAAAHQIEIRSAA